MASHLAPGAAPPRPCPAPARGGRPPASAGQRQHGQREARPGQQQDVDRPAAHGQQPHPAQRQQQPEQRGTDQRQADDDQSLPPVPERDQHQADADGEDREEQRQLPDDPGQERVADVEGRLLRERHGHADRASRATCCSAASTTFCSSIARVIGPTPPGFGATKPATSTTSRETSPAILPSTRLTPTSRTAAPGFTTSAVTRPGTPAAATTMSALRRWPARSRVPVWQSVTVAFSERRVSSSPRGRPTVMPRPTTTTSAPAMGTS